MSPIRQQATQALANISEHKLKLLMPLLEELMDDDFVVETNLSKEEKEICEKAEKNFNPKNYVPFNADSY